VLTTRQATTSTAPEFVAFLDQLATRWPDEHLILVLDNAAYHKTATIRAWFAAHHDRISVLWLPTYSPQLNLIERVWRFVKQKLGCHRYWTDRDGSGRIGTVWRPPRKRSVTPSAPPSPPRCIRISPSDKTFARLLRK
jgi:transposase